jgi:ribosomal protein S19/ribosomal protein L22
MGRSLKKGPYVTERLLEKVYKADNTGNRDPIKTWSRACTIVPEFVGKNFSIHNGQNFIKLYVTETWSATSSGEFAPTRTFAATAARAAKGEEGTPARAPPPTVPHRGNRPCNDRSSLPPRTASPAASVRKLRPILDLIRGKYADDAVNILKYMPHRGARMIEQVLKSAMANAEDKGTPQRRRPDRRRCPRRRRPMVKRLMPRARGMAYMIRRRSAHISIGLADRMHPTATPSTPKARNAAAPTRHHRERTLTDGPEGASDRVPRRDHGGLAEPLVCLQARIPRPPGRGLQDSQIHQGQVQLRGIPKVEIERTRDAVTVRLFTARPGVIIGRKGEQVEKITEELQTLTGRRIDIKIEEVTRPRSTPSWSARTSPNSSRSGRASGGP